MTQPELEQWLRGEGASDVVVQLNYEACVVRVNLDVGSNQSAGLLDRLNQHLLTRAAVAVQFAVACRCTYTGVVVRETLPRWGRLGDGSDGAATLDGADEVLASSRQVGPRARVYYPRSVAYLDGI